MKGRERKQLLGTGLMISCQTSKRICLKGAAATKLCAGIHLCFAVVKADSKYSYRRRM